MTQFTEALTGTVSISGQAIVGQTLTAVTTSLNGSGTITYQWNRRDTAAGVDSPIANAINSTYTLVANDNGKYITITVTRNENNGSVTSSATEAVALPALSGTVSINGTAIVGQTLTAGTGSLNGSGTITYQWNRRDTAAGTDSPIANAARSTYTLVTDDSGKYITVTVTRSGNNGSVTSSATAAVQNTDISIGPPKLSAADLVFSPASGPYTGTFTVTAPEGFESYRWLVDGNGIGEGRIFTLNLETVKLGEGTHSITLIAVKGGAAYSAGASFTIGN
jgi:hypothetical protein